MMLAMQCVLVLTLARNRLSLVNRLSASGQTLSTTITEQPVVIYAEEAATSLSADKQSLVVDADFELDSDRYPTETEEPIKYPPHTWDDEFRAGLCANEAYYKHDGYPLSDLVRRHHQVQLASAVIECLWCPVGASPPPGKCKNYKCGGATGVHYYTCCNPCDAAGNPGGDTPEYDGSSDGNYCGVCGANLGKGCDNSQPYTGGGPGVWSACKDYCDRCAITFPGACWNWTSCFNYCTTDGDPSDGVDGWICMSL